MCTAGLHGPNLRVSPNSYNGNNYDIYMDPILELSLDECTETQITRVVHDARGGGGVGGGGVGGVLSAKVVRCYLRSWHQRCMLLYI